MDSCRCLNTTLLASEIFNCEHSLKLLSNPNQLTYSNTFYQFCQFKHCSFRYLHRFLQLYQYLIGYTGCLNCCGLLRVLDACDEVIYEVQTPCVLSACFGFDVDFAITDMNGEEVGY